MTEPAYRIDIGAEEIVVRVRRDACEEISRFLDLLELQSIRRRNKLAEADASRLPDELFCAATALADRLGVSRSELHATALSAFVAEHDEREITARLDRLYATEPSGLDEPFRRAQRESIGKKIG